jgi:ComF family protein
VRLGNWLHHLIDFCYPRACAVCESGGEFASELCPKCLEELQKLEFAPACDFCSMPVAEHGSLCPHCEGKGVKPFDRIVRLGVFRDPLRHLIHQLKYHHHWTLAEYLAERLLALESVKGLLTETQVIVPVPLHPFRQISRGYNQAEVVARRLRRLTKHHKFSRALVRLKNTETQTHLHAKEKRFENLRDAFGLIKPRAVRGKHVVLVDDVMTTGATLISAGRTLLEAEPASISAIVIGIADPRGRDFEAI